MQLSENYLLYIENKNDFLRLQDVEKRIIQLMEIHLPLCKKFINFPFKNSTLIQYGHKFD